MQRLSTLPVGPTTLGFHFLPLLPYHTEAFYCNSTRDYSLFAFLSYTALLSSPPPASRVPYGFPLGGALPSKPAAHESRNAGRDLAGMTDTLYVPS